MYITIIILPIITSFMILISSRFIGMEGTKRITKIIYSICLIMSFIIMNEIKNSNIKVIINLPIKWIETLIWKIEIELYYDKYSIIMLCLIFSISTIVLYYSIWYLENDPNLIKFIVSIQIFTISMVLLVLSNNWFIFFIGWEMMGIFSYILINFWDTSIESNKSALKALLYNRIGDISLILSMLFLFHNYGIFHFHLISLFQTTTPKFYFLFFLILASFVKSALFPFHGWLVSAMQGPTPVSALLHAATMVTAGIYLLIRVKEILSDEILIIIIIIGTITLFFGSLSSLFLFDIKKIIALSTCSQIGYMLLAIGLKNFNNSLFHLFTHGFFKALLFLCSGILIHALFNEQDFRKFGAFSLLILILIFLCLLVLLVYFLFLFYLVSILKNLFLYILYYLSLLFIFFLILVLLLLVFIV